MMIAAALVAAPSPAAARKFARQDYGALEILNVHRAARRHRAGELILWRVSYVAPCPHCGGPHVDVIDDECPLLAQHDLAVELEPNGAIPI
jgi:hypothetical protein